MKHVSILFACLLLLQGCAELGIKSLPWPTYSPIYDSTAADFLRTVQKVDDELGKGLAAKPMLDDSRLIGLSVSGGGARATAFTLGILAELQTIGFADHRTALDRIDFLSTNSGGSWAVAAYLVDRADHRGAGYSLAANMPALRARFVAMSEGRVPCWAQAMQAGIPGAATFGQIYAPERTEPLPRVFFNASLLPAHAPFVFTDAFLRHYAVRQFGACKARLTVAGTRLADLPIAYAAASSGAVPGFYASFARTALCDDDGPIPAASFCHGKRKGRRLSYLRLADGGLYDNIGYKTAFEVMESQPATIGTRRAMILINSAASMDQKSIARKKTNASFLMTTASNGIFAVQDSSFERLYRPMFRAVGVDSPVLLDFYSTAHFPEAKAQDLLKGLDHLAAAAAYDVRCFQPGNRLDTGGSRPRGALPDWAASFAHLRTLGSDCVANNFYRVGNAAKTSYKFDADLFTTLWQLGQLSVRMHRDEIAAALE
ncbi:hypothetical protein J3E64_001743 [Sphingobium sp. OAS761]|uniref:patatin-like phospholipase family protein n=1 Tax=Sphingobium sp. OAS761 TaxID=2817901 RepID=UPI00209DF6B9|nr:patatin-like phospholipase family protein [Sphingobium sp. OAS761]MCP1470056.1 hypothetical protein [Sphingobium sp. OAS761]